jgi:aspartate/methionine/tyrosine aminotransferase
LQRKNSKRACIPSPRCAGIAGESLAEAVRDHYRKRLRRMADVLNAVGFNAKMSGSTFYLYVKVPKGAGNVEFSENFDPSGC